MNRIDLSKLPPPKLVEEIDYKDIMSEMRDKMREICPEWTGYELESDPANKVLEVAAYREMLIRQRINEAARSVMVAFATGSDQDHLAAFYPEGRLKGAPATFTARLSLSTAIDVEVAISAGFAVVAKNGAIEARLVNHITVTPGLTDAVDTFEVVKPVGADGNGLTLQWDAITPLPFVVRVEQLEPTHGGSDDESDEAFRARIPEALEKYSTCGAFEGYEAWAKSADARIKDAKAWTPRPGYMSVAVLSHEGDGTADEAMIRRVEEILSPDKRRPGTDYVDVYGAEIVAYNVRMTIEVYPGVAGEPPINEAAARVREKIIELHGLGLDVPRTALTSAAHVEGVKSVGLHEPASDIHIEPHEAAWCASLEIGSRIADEF